MTNIKAFKIYHAYKLLLGLFFLYKIAIKIPVVEIGSQRRDKYNELNGTRYFDAKAFLKTRVH